MNEFQNTESGSALLKDSYQGNSPQRSPLEEALRRKRRKLTESRLDTTLNEPTDEEYEK